MKQSKHVRTSFGKDSLVVCVCVPDWDEKRQYSCEVFVCPRVAEEEQVRTSFGRDSIVVLVSVPVWAEEKQCIDVAETFPPEKC